MVFTIVIADIEIVEPSNLMPYCSSVRYFSNTLLEQKVTGVRMPKSTGIQTGKSSPSFTIFGASFYAGFTFIYGPSSMMMGFKLSKIVQPTIKTVPTR